MAMVLQVAVVGFSSFKRYDHSIEKTRETLDRGEPSTYGSINATLSKVDHLKDNAAPFALDKPRPPNPLSSSYENSIYDDFDFLSRTPPALLGWARPLVPKVAIKRITERKKYRIC